MFNSMKMFRKLLEVYMNKEMLSVRILGPRMVRNNECKLCFLSLLNNITVALVKLCGKMFGITLHMMKACELS